MDLENTLWTFFSNNYQIDFSIKVQKKTAYWINEENS